MSPSNDTPIPGVRVAEAKPTPPKSMAQSKTIWSFAASAVVMLIGKWFPDVVSEQLAESIAVIFAAIGAAFMRKGIENSRVPVTPEPAK